VRTLDHHHGPETRDARNKNYRIGLIPRAAVALPARRWWLGGPVLDQGQTGHCGGFGAADEAAASPVRVRPMTDAYAHAFYYRIKDRHLDNFGREDGTSVQAVMKNGQLDGLWQSYGWAMSMSEFDLALEHGPVIVGTDWTDGMFSPNADGVIEPTGNLAGGHCYVFTGRRSDHPKYGAIYRLRNSWGRGWGVNGNAYLRRSDVEHVVFGRDGEAAIPLHREFPKAKP
jgi:hypothetical protein